MRGVHWHCKDETQVSRFLHVKVRIVARHSAAIRGIALVQGTVLVQTAGKMRNSRRASSGSGSSKVLGHSSLTHGRPSAAPANAMTPRVPSGSSETVSP
jgi:hypothetical protein